MYVPVRNHTHFSILASSAKPELIGKECSKYGYKAAVISDYSNLSGSIAFNKAMKKVGIKPIFGVRFLTTGMRYVSLIARNLAGWKQLIKLVSYSNNKNNIIGYKPTLTTDEVIEACKERNLILSFGATDSSINEDIIKEFISSVDNDLLFGEIDNPRSNTAAYIRGLPIRTLAAPPSFYASKSDAIEHRVLLASNAKSTIEKINKERGRGAQSWMDIFFAEDTFHVPSIADLEGRGYTRDEIENTGIIDTLCDSFDITNRPSLPKFDCPNGLSEADYLRQLCRDGWKKRRLSSWDEKTYVDRIQNELKVIGEASLEGYFLIVRDFIQYARSMGWMTGPGRGCFLPDTRVKMSNGTYTPISLINTGDEIIDAYGQQQKVIDTLEYDISEEIIELEFENGKIIRCTKDHLFLTKNRGWVEAQNLTEDDDISEV